MKLDIPSREFAGYIFDLDGTLADTMPLHYRAWNRAMQQMGMKEVLDEDLFYSLGGVHSVGVAAIFGKRYGLTFDPEKVMILKESFYLELIPEVKEIAPVAAFARQIAKTHPRAIGTGGLPEIAIPTLEAVGLRSLFDIIITPNDVPHGRGKPAPDMFLKAAERMNVSPADVLVFEDAEPGIAAARAAGMHVVRVPSRVSS